MSGSCMNEMNLLVDELEDILRVVKQLGGDRCTLYKDNSSGIGYLLSCGVYTQVEGIKGELIVSITDESSW